MIEAAGEQGDLTPRARCRDCPHRFDRLEAGRCKPGDTCVRAMSGRQIERFFRENPDLAEDYRGDGFWERRAIAARYLSQRRLRELLHDPDEVVRRVLAYRLPETELVELMDDPDIGDRGEQLAGTADHHSDVLNVACAARDANAKMLVLTHIPVPTPIDF